MIKRGVDFSVSLFLLLLLLPLYIIIAIIIRIKLGSPVLFEQRLTGRNMKPFTMLKFRTLPDSTDNNEVLLVDEAGCNDLGLFLRRSRLDHLPQLMNVVKGDMSLIGPQPLQLSSQQYFTAEEKKRFSIRPGITGLTQVSGIVHMKRGEQFAMDIHYVENHSVTMDAVIMWKEAVMWFRHKRCEEAPDQSLSGSDDEENLQDIHEWDRKR
ncbi:sugar transferase [Paenibacillus periandrae]|uniref:sugar transferase n=1 Tax=Paenibacillus periandrae TaxID=1761741 RepID=UPI001F0932A6|nr:sugar transferase [Paenibacillus periandrae]